MLFILGRLVALVLGDSVQGVDVLELSDLDEVLKFKELLHSGELNPPVFLSVLASVLSVQNIQNLLRDIPMGLIVIVIVKDISKESF